MMLPTPLFRNGASRPGYGGFSNRSTYGRVEE